MADEQTINVITPDGKFVAVPSDALHEAIQSGYRLATPEEQHVYNQQIKYGEGTLNEVKAFGEGAGRGLTFGATDYIAPALGLATKEDIAGRKQYNPTAAITGEITGAVAPSLLAPESIAGRLPVGLLGKSARFAESGLAKIGKAAAELAPEGSLAARGIEKAGHLAAKTLAGAGEGAAFGAGQAFSEDALGNPEPLGESLLANMGYGAMWGGGLGGGLGFAESVIPKAASMTKSVMGKAYETLLGKEAAPILDEAGAITNAGARETGVLQDIYGNISSKATGKSLEETMAPFQNPDDFLLKNETQKQAHIKLAENDINAMLKQERELSKQVFSEHKPKAFSELLEGHDIAAPNQLTTDFVTKADEVQQAILADPDQYAKNLATQVGEIKDGVMRRLNNESTAADHFEQVEGAKRRLDGIVEQMKNKQSDKIIATVPMLRDLAGLARKGLEDETIWGKAASVQQSLNEASSELIKAQKALLKSIGEKDPNTGRLVAAPTKISTFYNGIKTAKGQQTLERLNNYRDKLTRFTNASEEIHNIAGAEFDAKATSEMLAKNYKNVDIANKTFTQDPNSGHGKLTDMLLGSMGMGLPLKFAEQVVKHLQNPSAVASKLANINSAAVKVGKTVDNLAKKAYEPILAGVEASKEGAKKIFEKESVDKKIEETTSRIKSIDNMHKQIQESTNPISGFAPKISSALQRSMINGALFLHSKIPDWSDNSTAKPFDAPKPISWAQNAKFMRYYDAVDNPISVMKDAVSGTANPQGIEVLQTVYPNLYANMKTSLLNEIVSKKAKNADLVIPYQKRVVLSQFLGVNLDSTTNPSNIMANQAIMASKANEKKQQESSMINPTQKGLSNIDLAGRSMTPAQQNNLRES